MDFVIVNHKRGKETKHERNFHLSSFITPAKAQFYADRTPRSDSDHRDSGGNAAACVEQGEKHGRAKPMR